jgi:hypothetical protein
MRALPSDVMTGIWDAMEAGDIGQMASVPA